MYPIVLSAVCVCADVYRQHGKSSDSQWHVVVFSFDSSCDNEFQYNKGNKGSL